MSELKLPEDYTGKSPTNLVKNEPVTTVNRQVRAILPEYGAFYAKSVVLVDVATGKTLTRGVQYVAVEMYPEPTARSGQEVCAVILVTDDRVGNSLWLSYQALGGENGYSVKALQALIDGANIDGKAVDFYSIQGRPVKYPVAPHQHAGRDIYGWDFVVRELQRLATTVKVGSVQSRQQALELLIRVLANVMTEAEQLMQAFTATHRADALAHGQYVGHDELGDRIDLVRRPTVQVAVNGASVVMNSSPFVSFYGLPHAGSHFQVSRQPDFAALLVDRTRHGVQQYVVTETLPAKTQLYARVRYSDSEGALSSWTIPTPFTTA